ncbi:alkyl hydroperoxide reductase AhpD [Dietzia sp. NCCP-2495]|uniref:carboxymuconolactone decarboxylase family protein n=1 Tax=Dietzia sp. NCCP-2495 TaxID=2934675 RepID=UPI0022306233|nr:carboxymuconolactone decarboxylase family protein [Dietzia sp. NCCP-2495]GLB64791.1 alkyl hydroperoxide reductase AhpD [Dietzia sp. NCCP-2495]
MAVPQLDRVTDVYRQLVRTAVASREASIAAGLNDGLLELVNVRVSQINGCAACLSTHVPAARKAGVSQRRLDLLPAWRDLDGFGDQERAALRLAETLTRLDDSRERADALAAATELFDADQIAALEWTVVLINAFNRVSIASHHQPRIDD